MDSIIFKNVYDKVSESASNINSYFNNIDYYDDNIYNILYKIPKYNIIIYIFLITLIYGFINRLKIRLNEILTFLFSVLIIYLLIKKDYTEFIKYTQLKKSQLNFLHKLIFNKGWSYAKHNNLIMKPTGNEKSYLYLNPVIVELFYNIRQYSQYNISSYINSIIHCNNVLGLYYEAKIGIDKTYMNYELAIEESKKALNELSSTIYNIPLTKSSYVKLNESVKILHELLNKNIKSMSELFKNENKINDINMFSMPNNFYDDYFFIMSNDTKTRDYNSTYNIY
jgi:hypothetical protein